jgi:PPIC-type PPIASE domain
MRIVCIAAVALMCSAALTAQSLPADSTPRDQAAVTPRQEMRMSENKTPVQEPLPPTALAVSPESPVITLQGACDHPQKVAKGSVCKTVITRSQLDGLIDLLVPGATQEVRAQFAVNYARMLAAADLAQRQHLDKNATLAKEIQARQNMMRLQLLSSDLFKAFEIQAAKVSAPAVFRYYTEHTAEFERGDVQRLTLPKAAQTSHGTLLDAEAVKAKAEALRARAAAGEDFDKLQHEAYKDLDLGSIAPSTSLNHVSRGSLPGEQAGVFDLQPGETTAVLDSRDAFFVLKLDSKNVLPVESVRPEIESVLRNERMQALLQSANSEVKVDFNLTYLQAKSAPELFPAPGTTDAYVRPRPITSWRSRRSVTAAPSH